jgi:hypothetical protein
MKSIDQLVEHLYDSISFEKGEMPELEKLKELFIPEGRLINNSNEVPEIFTVDTFILAFRKQMEDGKIPSFEEKEISAHTDIFGTIAQRFSTYEARLDLKSTTPFAVGINSIQMIQTDGRWRISCMVWNQETEELKVPKSYR